MQSRERAREKVATKSSPAAPLASGRNRPPQAQSPLLAPGRNAGLDPRSMTAGDLLRAQGTLGNRAVGQLLAEGRKPPRGRFAPAQRQEADDEEEEVLQGKSVSAAPSLGSQWAGPEPPDNRNGMPDRLRAGIEALSGVDLSGVRVHYNSSKPARLGAFAYTQGQDIYLGPRQEKHLPHEGWHVVQQMQGRVRPTIQAKGVWINDDSALEREADRMGGKALREGQRRDAGVGRHHVAPALRPAGAAPIQRAMKFEIQTTNHIWMQNKTGSRLKPVPRKYGAQGASEKGEESFLTTGVEGKPHVRPGDMVEAKGIDPSKPAQFVWTYTVLDMASGKVRGPRRRRRKRRKVNRGTYELRYEDRTGKRLNVHRDGHGRFKPGRGPIMKKAKKMKEGSAIELQAEQGGFIEFETPKWFRRWSDIKDSIQEAYDMTKAMEKAPLITDKATKDAVRDKVEALKKVKGGKRKKSMGELREWPAHFRVGHLPIIKAGGRLIVEIVDKKWKAFFQASESIALQEYESLLKEHGRSSSVGPTLQKAGEIFDTLKPAVAAERARFERDHANLESFLQIVVYYILRGQVFSGKSPAKAAFRLMSRTSFYSIYRSLLSKKERALFRKLVKDGTIPAKLGLSNSDRVFKRGHKGMRAAHKDQPKIGSWLVSIHAGGGRHPDKGSKKTDLLSRPKGGSAAMGRFDVDTRSGKKHSSLVKFEVRGTRSHGGRTHERDDWLKFAKAIFESALKKRNKRPGLSKVDAKSTKLLKK